MKILLRQARIVDTSSPFHLQEKDILIVHNTITEIDNHIDCTDCTIIDHPNLSITPGWVDIFANFCDPGLEYKETLETGAQAAAAGGFTHVMLVPNTQPVVHAKTQVDYIIEKGRQLPVHLHPIGAVSKNTEGKELAEMYDMFTNGAVAFSDGFNAIQSPSLMIKALQYIKAFDGVLMQLPDDHAIAPNGLINEGVISTRLGLPGKPTLAEDLMVARDIQLAAYTNSKLHFTGVTSAASIELIRQAKRNGIAITCSVTPHHLLFTDADLVEYDTQLKVNLPFRTQKDVDALHEGILDGTVDCISSHHQPHEWDSKICEFEYAKFGIIGLETCFGILGKLGISEEKINSLLCNRPREIFSLATSTINIGSVADCTLYLPEETFTFETSNIRSISKNTPFIGKTLKGKVIGILNKNQLFLNKF
jgi:dihydroorotase